MNARITSNGLGSLYRYCLVLLWGTMIGGSSAVFWWAAVAPTLQAAEPEFVVTDWYEPRGWMLNAVDTADFDFNDDFRTNCADAAPCIRVIWEQPQADQWLGLYWVHPDSDVSRWPQIGQPGCDLHGATQVRFWARGEQGGEKVYFEAAFYAGAHAASPLVTLSQQWQQYTIDLTDASLDNVVGAFAYIVKGEDNPTDVTFYLDDIVYLGVAGDAVLCQDVTPTPTATTTPTATPDPNKTPTATATATATTVPDTTDAPLVLVYAVLDNNLGREQSGSNWRTLINNLEFGTHDGIRVRLLIDAFGPNNSYVYDLHHDKLKLCPSLIDMTCGDRYIDGTNRHIWTEDTAQPQSLHDFVVQSMRLYPNAAQTILVMVGHGSGWAANGLPSQPTRWAEQVDERIGGVLWDDTLSDLDGSQSFSTHALGVALSEATSNVGRKLDLLYLDACSMGVVEVAYEVRDSARFFLASPNTDWATYSYNELLTRVDKDKNTRTLGQEWIAIEGGILRRNHYPFTLSLLALEQLSTLQSATDVLAKALIDNLPAERTKLAQILTAIDRYESDYDGKLTQLDTYVDVNSMALQLVSNYAASSVIHQAAIAVQTALADVVVAKDVASGSPWIHPEEIWRWTNYGGVGVYLPIPQDDKAKRLLYGESNLLWAKDGQWDEFLFAYWPAALHAAGDNDTLPTCASTSECEAILAKPLQVQESFLFLPVVMK